MIEHVEKRDGTQVPFTPIRITNAIYRAATAVGGRDIKKAKALTEQVIEHLGRSVSDKRCVHVENIQDTIEKVLIENGNAATAKAFILYRNARIQDREGRLSLGDSPSTDGLIPWKKVWESLNWSVDHGVLTTGQLNGRINSGSFCELVNEAEQYYKFEIACAADVLLRNKKDLKIVIVAGPSSSGKTTTTLKIADYLKGEGLDFLAFHVDNYFYDLELHPRDESGDYDYETPEAIDLGLLNEHLRKIVQGKKVRPPFFNFKTGKREGTGDPVELKPGQVLLIDSHHGLYDRLTEGIDDSAKIRFYIEPLAQIRSADGSYMKWTDIRLMRRIYRDARERNIRPDMTLKHWHYVRKSELMYIVPYALKADFVINSYLAYELPVWKTLLGDIFRRWAEDEEMFPGLRDCRSRVRRVSGILQSIEGVEDFSDIPGDSLIREFIGHEARPMTL